MFRFVRGLAGSIRRLSGRVSARWRKSSRTRSVLVCSNDTGPTCTAATISETSRRVGMESQPSDQLPLFPQGPHASRPVLPGSEEAAAMTDGSGRRLLESLSGFYRDGSWQKILLVSLVSRTAWRSRNGLLVWRWRDMSGFRRSYIQLQHSVPTTGDIESSLLPTLTASEGGRQRSPSKGAAIRPSLGMIAKMLPTLIARDGRVFKGSQAPPDHTGAESLIRAAGGTLDPVFCEWFLGFEDGWTDVE